MPNALTKFVRSRIKTGIYTGDDTDNRNIDIGVNLEAKANVYVIIKANYMYMAEHRIEYGQGDYTMSYQGLSDYSNRIQHFTTTGFEVGSADEVNVHGFTYRYIVFYEEW